nr:CDP-alcohol phosphatidyltransferase family protein [Solirubrobacterales bacterium]
MRLSPRELTEGEQWAREQLAALLTRRFSPPAVGAFLLVSQRRANAERAARPATATRMRRWMLAGAVAYGAHALAARRGAAAFEVSFAQSNEARTPGRSRGHADETAPSLSAALAWWGATWVMLDWHIGMLETEDGRARNLGPADAVTLTRAWMVPLVARRPDPALVLAAWASDGLDGRLARATEPTRLGRDLEGLVDA